MKIDIMGNFVGTIKLCNCQNYAAAESDRNAF